MNKLATWEATRLDRSHYRYTCSHCGAVSMYKKCLFCPSCGRQMVEKGGAK